MSVSKILAINVLKKMCFTFFFKVSSVVAFFKGQGDLFHNRGPQIEKALVPYAPRARGTSRLLQDLDLNTLEGL